MSKHNIDIWGLQTLQTALEPLNDVLPRQASGVWLLATSAEKDLSTSVELKQRNIHESPLCSERIRHAANRAPSMLVPSQLRTGPLRRPPLYRRS
jgi:hypothetical protein